MLLRVEASLISSIKRKIWILFQILNGLEFTIGSKICDAGSLIKWSNHSKISQQISLKTYYFHTIIIKGFRN